MGQAPGTFFWKPRLGIDLSIPTTEVPPGLVLPSLENVEGGVAIIFEGYQAGITFISLASGLTSGEYYPHLNPLSAFYYTNAYRWFLRHVSLLPFWIGGAGGHYCDTHRVWKRRFYYLDEFIPEWMRNLLFFVKKDTWDKELTDYKMFKKYAEPAFGKHFRFPSKIFKDFESEYTQETVEDMSISLDSLSQDKESSEETDEDQDDPKLKDNLEDLHGDKPGDKQQDTKEVDNLFNNPDHKYKNPFENHSVQENKLRTR